MARYSESVCRLCRREGMKLFLKGDRCFKDKCAIERRNYPAGPARPEAHASSWATASSSARSRRSSGSTGSSRASSASPSQRAERRKGITGANLLEELERRLDNVVVRARLRGVARAGAPARPPRPRHGRTGGRSRSRPSASARARSSPSRRRAAPTSRSRPRSRRRAPAASRPGSTSTPETFSRTGRGVAEARRHQAADPGAADRRAVLEVSPRTEERIHDALERFSEARSGSRSTPRR